MGNFSNKPSPNIYLQFGKDAFQKETEKARLLVVDNEQIWLPKSQIIFFEEKDGLVNVTLPEWLVKKNPVLQEHLDPEWVAAGCPD